MPSISRSIPFFFLSFPRTSGWPIIHHPNFVNSLRVLRYINNNRVFPPDVFPSALLFEISFGEFFCVFFFCFVRCVFLVRSPWVPIHCSHPASVMDVDDVVKKCSSYSIECIASCDRRDKVDFVRGTLFDSVIYCRHHPGCDIL